PLWRGDVMRERGTRAEPAREHETDLCPAEGPRDRADAADPLARAGAIRGTRAEARVGQLVDRRHLPEHREQRFMFLHQLAIDRERPFGEIGHHRAVFAHVAVAALVPGEFLEQRARERDLERALGDGDESELLRDDLALLRDLDAAVDGARRERGQCARNGRSAPASHTAAASMEEPQRYSRLAADL